MAETNPICPDLEYLAQRVASKREDYGRYHFSDSQNDILQSYFDLAQEFDSLQDFYRICVTVPRIYLGVMVNLYLVDHTPGGLELVCSADRGFLAEPEPAPAHLVAVQDPYMHDHSYLVPICRRRHRSEDAPALSLQSRCLGLLEITPAPALSEQDRFFFGKYANRIAYNLHNRRLMQQNIRHLEFINNLVQDIEHNVIIPNMFFRHLFKQLRKSIAALTELRRDLEKPGAAPVPAPVKERLAAIEEELDANHRQLMDHHANTSLFLESLFRRDHFREGHLVLRARPCKVENEIVRPQLENFLSRLDLYGIKVEYPPDMGEEFDLIVDIGLLAQVYANLFSNVVKYTEEVIGRDGKPRKAVAYGRERLKDYFGVGKDGIKFNVFSTGPHLPPEEMEKIYEDGFRGKNAARSPGTGHGLSFIRQVVEIHGGRVGCEPVRDGNNFYFVLPLYPQPAPGQLGS